MNPQSIQQPILAEYLQKLQNSSHPLSLQQFLMIQPEQLKKEKQGDQKNDQTQNSILNIPSVPTYKNPLLQSHSQYLRNEHTLMTLNPSDVNVHMEDHGSSHIQSQSIKREQTPQTESSKSEKKMKFRAKIGEIKMTVALDGSTLYCCPECSLAFSQKSEIDEHIQIHISVSVLSIS